MDRLRSRGRSQENLRGCSPFVCPENKFLVVGWREGFFLVLWFLVCLLVGNDGTPPTMAGLLESILWQDSPARSLGNKDLEVKSLFFFHLRDVPSRVRALGWALLLAPGVGPRFRPDQKVKLDKSEARRGAAHPPAVMKEPALRSRRRGGPLLKKNEKWGTPLYFSALGWQSARCLPEKSATRPAGLQ